ncbi:MAG: di-heme oxidoredictase family protein [Planctomycetota bacterium]
MRHELTLALTLLLPAASAAAQEPPAATRSFDPVPLGGPATVEDAGPNAFGYPAPILDRLERRQFLVGNSFFKQNWVEAPASTSARDGLGPLFNARSCSACHLRDGRSAPPAPGDLDRHGLLIRIGARAGKQADRPHPAYGGQIQDVAIGRLAPEARVRIEYRAVAGEYGDGSTFELLAPTYALDELGYGPLGDDTVLGPRTAPQLIGLGLLEAVPVATLRTLADPDDADGDGVSGRVHWLGDGEDAGAARVGRFGWKATQPTVLDQIAAAFVNDMGITSSLHPHEPLSDAERPAVDERGLDDQDIEINDKTLGRVAFYTRALAVPAQRQPLDPEIAHGQQLFDTFRCTACHVPELQTGDDAFHPGYATQRFRPYTDLLLHDMGDGLADDKRDGTATPAEWRTPPLWGIGLIEAVNGHTRYLHDGRARNLAEAILWHGGEAEAAKERFRQSDAAARAALLAFLGSL